MTHRMIRIRDAQANNLRHVDVDIPRDRLIVVSGVSGSGKSSLIFDTVAAEAGAELNETFPPFVRNRLPKWTRPAVGSIMGLSMVIVTDQRRLGSNARSTVGTVTDAWTYLRLLFSRLSEPHVGESNHFSFNDQAGMCPTCQGLGEVVASAVDRFLDLDRSLQQGAIRVPGFGNGGYWYNLYADIGSFDPATPLRDWSQQQRQALLYGGAYAARLGTKPPGDYEGVVERFERIYLHTSDAVSERKQQVIDRFTRAEPCSDCHGERLNRAGRTATVGGHTIGELSRLEIAELRDVIDEISDARVASVTRALTDRLDAMNAIGLGYLHLARATGTLSGGESQRIKAVKHLGSSLIETVYVFDEPTVGLHPSDVDAMIALLKELRDRGNTVLVVEHDPAVMAAADHLIELGPGAGEQGGRLIFEGTWTDLLTADTPTSRALRTQQPIKENPRTPRGWLTVRDATRNNLRGVTVDIPQHVLTVLTGVAGSGKSSLAAELGVQHQIVSIDQKPVAGNRRSTPITFTNIAGPLRKLFARHTGAPAGLFSANSEGGCSTCNGLGVLYTDLAFMDGQETVCPACGGSRFNEEALSHTVDGLSIADVDRLAIDEALVRLPDRQVIERLKDLARVGLGYLRLGQPLSTLSGGESQRVKIAKELRDTAEHRVYVLDEPTTGLHLSDIATLLNVLDALIERGHTVVVIEHNLEVIKRADWVIDLGPGPGRHGGEILYAGPVREMSQTATAAYLRPG